MEKVNEIIPPYVLIKIENVISDGEVVRQENKLRKPNNNGRKILAIKIEKERFGEIFIDDPNWKVPRILPTGGGGIEVATLTEFSSQDRHKHGRGTEIYTVLKGTMEIFVNDEGPCVLNESDEIIILPGTIHEVVQQKPDAMLHSKDFNLIVRVHSINCFGEDDKYVQLKQNGDWILWKELSSEEKKRAYKKQIPVPPSLNS